MHQLVREDPGEGSLKLAKVKPGEVDLWDFDLGEFGHELSCGNVRTLIFYLHSPRVAMIRISEAKSVGIGGGSFRVRITGPIADDGEPLWISYRLSGIEVAGLPLGDKILLQDGLKSAKGLNIWEIRRLLRIQDLDIRKRGQ